MKNKNGYDRYEVTKYLNESIMGFIEGTSAGLRTSVVDGLNKQFGIKVPLESVKIIVDELHKPDRWCWSIHVDHDGLHLESVIRNLQYDTGYEL